MKLSLGILLMAVPIFMVSLSILYVQSRNYVKNEATDHANSVLNTTMQRICRFMNTVETATDVNEWEIIENFQPDSLLAYSRYIVELNGNIDGCSISAEPNMFPKYGRYFSAYTVREKDTITTVVEQEYEYFQKIWYKTPRVLDEPCWVVYYDDVDSLDVVLDGMIASYGKPLYNAEKKFVGIISTDLSLLHLSKVISEEQPYKDSYFMMTGEEGRYYIHPDTTQLFTHTIFSDADPSKNPDIFALGHEMTTGHQGNMSVVLNGERCLVSYQPVPGTNWSLALVCPERSVLRSYNRLGFIIGPLTIIGLLLILLFSFTTVAQAIRPINKLAKKIQLIAEGHFDEQIKKTHYTDALGRLQNSFHAMQESTNRHMNDIQKMNDEAARRNKELVHISKLAEEANKQKSLFIQNVSHQVRTPLNIIMGFAQVLRESKSILPPEETKSITDMMKHNSLMLNRMSLMLFDSSARGTTEELYANKNEELYCNEIIRECINDLLNNHPDLPITFESEVPDDFCIHTNRLYLKRTIQELLFNAEKYSDRKNLVVCILERTSTICFIIEDTGPGIPEEKRDLMFEPFTKINDLSEGLGLGLPLAKRHIRNLGGDLTLDDKCKDGCRFVIELPKK
jgi:signal transduction histidine kinase